MSGKHGQFLLPPQLSVEFPFECGMLHYNDIPFPAHLCTVIFSQLFLTGDIKSTTIKQTCRCLNIRLHYYTRGSLNNNQARFLYFVTLLTLELLQHVSVINPWSCLAYIITFKHHMFQ